MVVTDPIHVAQWGVTVSTPEVSSEKATIQIKTRVKNETGLPQSITMKTRLSGTNAKNAGENQLNLEIPANSEKEVEQTIQVSEPLLWTPETPNLYKAQVQSKRPGCN
jgi:beta-galactosidase